MVTLSVALEAPKPAMWLKSEGNDWWTPACLNSAGIEFQL